MTRDDPLHPTRPGFDASPDLGRRMASLARGGAVATVERGELVVLRSVGLGYSVDLPRALRTWTTASPRRPARGRVRTGPKTIVYGEPPLDVALTPVQLHAEPDLFRASARIHPFGVASIILRLPFLGVAWPEVLERANALTDVLQDPSARPLWDTLIAELRDGLGPAIERPASELREEDYTMLVVEQWERPRSGPEALAEADPVPFLAGDTRALATGARSELLRHTHAWFADDLAIVTWDRAFLLEPSGDRSTEAVLETANAQLLELQFYDDTLDTEIPEVHARVREAGRPGLPHPRRYARLARGIRSRVAEIEEVRETVDNALQATEDTHLARVYRSALDVLGVPMVAAAVDRKLGILRDTYEALYDESETRLAATLEISIVALIVLEIVLALFGGH